MYESYLGWNERKYNVTIPDSDFNIRRTKHGSGTTFESNE